VPEVQRRLVVAR